jgi:hypothetical protein
MEMNLSFRQALDRAYAGYLIRRATWNEQLYLSINEGKIRFSYPNHQLNVCDVGAADWVASLSLQGSIQRWLEYTNGLSIYSTSRQSELESALQEARRLLLCALTKLGEI